MQCPSCRSPNPDDALLCGGCGGSLAAKPSCKACGREAAAEPRTVTLKGLEGPHTVYDVSWQGS